MPRLEGGDDRLAGALFRLDHDPGAEGVVTGIAERPTRFIRVSVVVVVGCDRISPSPIAKTCFPKIRPLADPVVILGAPVHHLKGKELIVRLDVAILQK